MIQRFLSLVGVLGVAGCAPSLPSRTFYPEWPNSGDVLARDPCSVRREPEIVIRGSEAERAEAAKSDPNYSVFIGKRTDAEIQRGARESVDQGLDLLRRANPVFLCGLERIEFLGNEAYAKAIEDRTRSFAYYDPAARILRIRLYGGLYPVVHEVGHHVHNLGYFAPAVRDFLGQSWVFNDDGERVRKCKGSHCFLYHKAGEDPWEDWARTFERVLLTPTETVIKTNLNLEVVGRTALQRKIGLIFEATSLEKPLAGTLRVGKAQSLPPSTFQVLAGSSLYLFDESGKTATEYVLQKGIFEKSANKPAKADFLFEMLRSQEGMDPVRAAFMGVQAGGHLFLMGREKNFQAGRDRSVPLSLWEIDPAGGGSLGAVAERHYLSKEVVLGGLTELDGEAGYFTFGGRKLALKTRAPGAKESLERFAWDLPENLIPLHVMPLGAGKGFGILVHEKGSPSGNPTMTIVRLTRNPDKEGDFNQHRGGSLTIEPEFWNNLRTPVRVGDRLLFPTYLDYGTTLGILVYDLSKDRFFAPMFTTEALPEEFQKAAGRLANLQLASREGQLYVIASVDGGPTLVAPIELKF